MNSTVLIISAVFPPEPVVSAKLSSDIVNDLVAFGIHVTVLHPKPTRPFGFYFNREKRAGLNFQEVDRKSTRLNSSHKHRSRMPSSA